MNSPTVNDKIMNYVRYLISKNSPKYNLYGTGFRNHRSTSEPDDFIEITFYSLASVDTNPAGTHAVLEFGDPNFKWMPLPFDPKHPTIGSASARLDYFNTLDAIENYDPWNHPYKDLLGKFKTLPGHLAAALAAGDPADEPSWEPLWSAAEVEIRDNPGSGISIAAMSCVSQKPSHGLSQWDGSREKSRLWQKEREFWAAHLIYAVLRAQNDSPWRNAW